MESKNFWLMTDAEKRIDISNAVQNSFGSNVYISNFVIDSGIGVGYFVIGYYDFGLSDTKLNSFNKHLVDIGLKCSYHLWRKSDALGISHLSIVYCIKRNK